MKRRNKILLTTLATCTLTTIIPTSVIANKNIILANTNSLKQPNGYIYEGEYFKNIQDVAKRYLRQHPETITNNYYLGNLSKAILDPSTGLVNINDLRLYDDSRLHPVYVDALGNYTYDYQKAKKTYVNPGLISYKYYDFNNNLFSTYEEAKESILNSKHPLGVQYYDDEIFRNNGNTKFNPLSKNDLQEFKRKTFNEVQNLVQNPGFKNFTNFSIKGYEKNYFDEVSKQWLYSSNSEHSILNNPNYFNDVLSDLIKSFVDAKLAFLKQQRFNVKLNLIMHGEEKRATYKVTNFKSKNANFTCDTNSNSLTYNDISFTDLQEFNMFINNSEFMSKNTTWIQRLNVLNYSIAREASVSLLETTFTLDYTGKDKGWDDGVDVDILKVGTESTANTYLSFEIIPKFVETNQVKLSLEFNKLLDEKINDLMSSIPKTSIKYQVLEILKRNLMNTFLNTKLDFDKTFKYEAGEENKESNTANSNDITNLGSNIVEDNQYLLMDKDVLKEDYTNSFSINPELKNIGLYNSLPENLITELSNLIPNIFNNSLAIIIEFNNKPLFKINVKFEKMNSLVNQSNNSIKSNIVLNESKTFEKQILDFSPESLNILNGLINVSQSFKTVNNSFNVLTNNTLISKDSENNWIFNYGWNSDFIEAEGKVTPEIKNNLETSYPLNTIVNTYNKILSQMKYDNKDIYEEVMKKQFVDPNEVVILYKGDSANNVPMATQYREFLSNNEDIAPTLIGNNSIKLLNDKNQIKALIKDTTITEPQKIVVLYDLSGNIINPGIKLNPDETISTSSDAIFDSEQTIIDNILRTKLIPVDTTKIFYLDDDNTYTLLDYKVNQIYTLNVEGKVYNYSTHKNCFDQLCEYVNKLVEVY